MRQPIDKLASRVRRLVGLLTTSALLAIPIALAQTPGEQYSVIAPLAARSLLLDVDSVDGRLIAVGERGHVLVSENQGHDWTQIRVPTRATLTAVEFFDDQIGLAVGHDAVILRTEDGGNTWQRVHFAPDEERPLLDVWYQTADQAIAVGAYGFYLETRNGGRSWTSRIISSRPLDEAANVSVQPTDEQLGDDFHLNQIVGSETGRLYMSAEAGTVYRSDDGGRMWSRLPSPYEGSFFGILPLHDDGLLLFGLQGRLFHSTDGGIHWRRIETRTGATLMRGIRLADGTIVIGGFSGTILVSQDDGNTFELVRQRDRLGIAGMLATDDENLVLVGEGGARRLSLSDIGVRPSS